MLTHMGTPRLYRQARVAAFCIITQSATQLYDRVYLGLPLGRLIFIVLHIRHARWRLRLLIRRRCCLWPDVVAGLRCGRLPRLPLVRPISRGG